MPNSKFWLNHNLPKPAAPIYSFWYESPECSELKRQDYVLITRQLNLSSSDGSIYVDFAKLSACPTAIIIPSTIDWQNGTVNISQVISFWINLPSYALSYILDHKTATILGILVFNFLIWNFPQWAFDCTIWWGVMKIRKFHNTKYPEYCSNRQ